MIFFEPKHKTATDAVKWYLQKHGSIDQTICIKKYGSWKLSRIIADLRQMGLVITSENKKVTTRFGEKTYMAVYKIVK